MWPKYLQLATFAYNMTNSPNLGNYSPYELVFSRKPKSLSNLESTPNTNFSGTFKDHYELLNKKLKYLHKLLLDFKSKRLAMINKDRALFSIYQWRLSLYNFTTHEANVHSFEKSHNKICRTSSYLQNYRPSQLSNNDIRWQNSKRTI